MKQSKNTVQATVNRIYTPIDAKKVLADIRASRDPVKRLQEILSDLYRERHSWRAVAEPFNLNAAMARLIAEQGYQPGAKIRLRLGLAPSVTVVVMTGGEVPPGTQVASALQCACGQWFVPNHPRRSRCFICSPYRGGRKPARHKRGGG